MVLAIGISGRREPQHVRHFGNRHHGAQTTSPVVRVMQVLPAGGFRGRGHKFGEQEQFARLGAFGHQALGIHCADPDVGAQRSVGQGAGPFLHPAGREAGRELHQNAFARRSSQVADYNEECIQCVGGLVFVLLPHALRRTLHHSALIEDTRRIRRLLETIAADGFAHSRVFDRDVQMPHDNVCLGRVERGAHGGGMHTFRWMRLQACERRQEELAVAGEIYGDGSRRSENPNLIARR